MNIRIETMNPWRLAGYSRPYRNVKSRKLALSYAWALCHEAVAARCWTRGAA